MSSSVVSYDLPSRELEAAYTASGPGIIHVDNLLTPRAVADLRRFCLESTIWYDFKHEGGYLGAYINEGFDCGLLLQIAEELPKALPGIFAGHRLTQMWAYKYDSKLEGIGLHADAAAINVNFWITPDEANWTPTMAASSSMTGRRRPTGTLPSSTTICRPSASSSAKAAAVPSPCPTGRTGG